MKMPATAVAAASEMRNEMADRRDELKRRALEAIDREADALVSLSKQIHANPEIGLQEHESSAACAAFLAARGFAVERGVADLPTAFAATRGTNGRTIAYLSEYDALAGIGHGCGHNLIAIAGLAAGIGLAAAVDELGEGRVQVFGTPAEETFGGKTIMAAAGVFNGVDAAMGAHPGTIDATCPTVEGSGESLARQEFTVRFHGKAAHAAADPYNGANALDALTLFYTGVSAFRQQTKTDARFHGVIVEGGLAPNVIPDFTETKYRARAATLTYMEELIEQVRAIADGAAMMTGCRAEIVRTINPYYDMITNHTLARQVKRHLDELGLMLPEATPEPPAGSTDWGNVSYIAPSVETGFPIMDGHCTWHSQAVVDAADTPMAYANTLTTAKALALTGIDLLLDADLMHRVKSEFADDLQARKVQSPAIT
jgi:amidohydrolase